MIVNYEDILQMELCGSLLKGAHTTPDLILWIFSSYLTFKNIDHEDSEIYQSSSQNDLKPVRSTVDIKLNPQILIKNRDDYITVYKLFNPADAEFIFLPIRSEKIGEVMDTLLVQQFDPETYSFAEFEHELFLVLKDSAKAVHFKLALE